MSWKTMIGWSFAVIGVMAALALAAWLRLPPGATLPVHWNAAGEADGFALAAKALSLPILMTVIASAVMAVLPRIEPLQKQLSESSVFYRAVWIALLAIFALVELVVVLPVFGIDPPGTMLLIGIGILLLTLGNLLPKTRPSFFVGIRTPWTLIDRENWISTHRMGGRTMMLAGAIILAAALLAPASILNWVTIAAILIGVIPPIIHSYLFWRRRRTG